MDVEPDWLLLLLQPSEDTWLNRGGSAHDSDGARKDVRQLVFNVIPLLVILILLSVLDRNRDLGKAASSGAAPLRRGVALFRVLPLQIIGTAVVEITSVVAGHVPV